MKAKNTEKNTTQTSLELLNTAKREFWNRRRRHSIITQIRLA